MVNTLIWSIIIFVAILTQVIFGTVRLIVMMRGKRTLAITIGFFEAMIALTIAITVISNAVKQGINVFLILSYGAGFALGLFIGMMISEKIAREVLSVNITSKKHSSEIEQVLRINGFGLTCYQGSGKDGNINVLNIVCKKNDLPKLQDLAQDIDPRVMVASHTLEGMKGGFFYDLKNRV